MKTRNIPSDRLRTAFAAVILLAIATFASSSSAQPFPQPPQNYTGHLTHAEFITCAGVPLVPPAYSISGTWVLRVDPVVNPQVLPGAALTLLVFRDGARYQHFPNLELMPVSSQNGVYHYSLAPGSNVTIILDTNTGTFSWNVEFTDNCTRRNYRSLSYIGVTN